MNTNIISAFVLASFACLSAACVNASTTNDFADEDRIEDSKNATNGAEANGKPVSSADHLVIPPAKLPFGASYEEWAAAYWQWALEIPAEKNPIMDGACERNQSGSVFFLAGTLGGSHQRSCTIPSDKGIFVPIFDTLARSCPEMADFEKVCPSLSSEAGIRSSAENTIDTANALLHVTLDGQTISVGDPFRVQSDLFSDSSPDNANDRLFATCSGPIESNICKVTEGNHRLVVTDGYFIMLHGLSEGLHQLHIAANVSPDSTEPPFELTYDLLITSTQSQ